MMVVLFMCLVTVSTMVTLSSTTRLMMQEVLYASGSITDTRNTFSSNKVNNNGGAVYVSGSFRSIIIDGSNFINNRARNGGGGALYVVECQ